MERSYPSICGLPKFPQLEKCNQSIMN
jgi:hypothetical protein